MLTAIQTNEEFWAFCEAPENADKLFELINGVIYEMPSPSPLHGLIISQILYLFKAYLVHQAIGYAFGDNNDFELAPGVVLKPDVAYISKTRLPKIPHRLSVAPEIAVEIVSPSNTEEQLLEKTLAFISFGTQLVWIVYPETKVVWVYRPAGDGSLNLRKFTGEDRLDVGDILPGFSIAVRDIFTGIELE